MDADGSNSIEADEIARAYASMNFPAKSAKILMQAITDKGYIDMEVFPVYDNYVNKFYSKFCEFHVPQLDIM